MTTCDWSREDWLERMVRALTPLVETVTAAPYGVEPIANERYQSLAQLAKTDARARAHFDQLLPRLNEEPGDLIQLVCQHPVMRPNLGGTGEDLATFVLMPSSGSRLQLSILVRFLTKSAVQHGCLEAVRHLDRFLALSSEGRVPGYQVAVFRGLAMTGEVEVAPGLEILEYGRAVERGLVRNEPFGPADTMPGYAGMGALVLARQMTWGPCIVPPLTSRDFHKDEFQGAAPAFRWAPGRSTGIVFDLLSVCASHKVVPLRISYCAPQFAGVYPGLVSGSGPGFFHGERWSKQDLAEDHVRHLRELLHLWEKFSTDKQEVLELAVSRLSSATGRNRGRFWVPDRILDAAIALEIMYELEPPELTNKLATRAAHLLAEETGGRIGIFDRVIAFYEARSRIAHGDTGKRQGKKNKKTIDFKDAAESGFTLASETLRALLDRGDFPNWKELIMSP